MRNNKISQSRQIKSSDVYNNTLTAQEIVNLLGQSGNLETDLNIIRSQIEINKVKSQEEQENHEKWFHHNRSDITKYITTGTALTDIKTFNNNAEDILLLHSAFTYTNGTLTNINKKIYNDEGVLYAELNKVFNYIDGNLVNITNEKII